MNHIERAVLYITRKKGKTLSLFLVIFTVAFFLFSCFCVLNASEKLSEDIRTSVGAAFYIRAKTQVTMNENGETEVTENGVYITQKNIDDIMSTGQIKYFNPINYGMTKSDRLQFIPGDKHTEESNMGKVTGLKFSALAPEFTDETASLTEGKHISECDKGKILISEQLASANNLSVGDTLTLTHARLGVSNGEYIDEIPVKTEYCEVKISGIYRLNAGDGGLKPTASIDDNKIYACLDVLDALKESEPGIYTGEVDFYITDPAMLDDITDGVRLLSSIDWTTHFIRTNDFRYSRIAERLSSLGDLVKILIVLVSTVSAVFLTLLISLRMRGRMRESGILLAAGISKGDIMAGFLWEVLSVAVIAMILSYAVSFAVTGFLEHSLFGGLQPRLLNDETLFWGTDVGVRAENYLRLSADKALLIYFCQLTVTAASTCVPSIIIMRLKPKEILSKMS